MDTLDYIVHKTHKPFRTMLGEYDSKEEAMKALDAHQAAIRARRTATMAGIAVTVVVCVFLLGLVCWYLRKRSKKLAVAKAEGRVTELELETTELKERLQPSVAEHRVLDRGDVGLLLGRRPQL